MTANRLNFRAWIPPGHWIATLEDGKDRMIYEWQISTYFDGERFRGDDGIVIMQSTGRCDKNGKEIFDGDICNVREYPHMRDNSKWKVVEVMWGCEDGWAFRGYYQGKGDGDYYGIRFAEVSEIEVIGNIYQNPELLEQA